MMYLYHTKVGAFAIIHRADRWHITFRNEVLGSYEYAQQAAKDLACGHTSTPPGWLDTSKLGIPEDISEWTWVG